MAPCCVAELHPDDVSGQQQRHVQPHTQHHRRGAQSAASRKGKVVLPRIPRPSRSSNALLNASRPPLQPGGADTGPSRLAEALATSTSLESLYSALFASPGAGAGAGGGGAPLPAPALPSGAPRTFDEPRGMYQPPALPLPLAPPSQASHAEPAVSSGTPSEALFMQRRRSPVQVRASGEPGRAVAPHVVDGRSRPDGGSDDGVGGDGVDGGSGPTTTTDAQLQHKLKVGSRAGRLGGCGAGLGVPSS